MMDIEQNFGLGNHGRFSRFGVLRGAARREAVGRYVRDMHIRPPRHGARCAISRAATSRRSSSPAGWRPAPGVLLFDEPTRGIDVGAKAEIYALLRRLAADGAAVVVVSSELPELLLLADRIGIVASGRLIRVVANDAGLTEERLMKLTSTDASHDR